MGAVSVEGEVGFEGRYDVVLRRSAGSYPERGIAPLPMSLGHWLRRARGPSGGSKLTKFPGSNKFGRHTKSRPFTGPLASDRSPTASGGNMGNSGRDGRT